MNHEWADIIKSFPITRYAPLNTLQTTRGCRFNCDFCSVIRINGRGSRHSPTDRVIEEIKVLKRMGQHVGEWAYVFFLDDDLAADLDFCGELSRGHPQLRREGEVGRPGQHRPGPQPQAPRPRHPQRPAHDVRRLRGHRPREPARSQQEEPPVGVRRARRPRPQGRRRHRGRVHLRLRQPGPRLLRGDGHLRRQHRRRRGPLLDPHALPGHRHLRPHAQRRPHHQLRLEALQHVLLRLPAGPDDGRPARSRPGHRLPGLLLPPGAGRAASSASPRAGRRPSTWPFPRPTTTTPPATSTPTARPTPATRPTPTTSRACWRPAQPRPRRPSTWPSRPPSPAARCRSPPRNSRPHPSEDGPAGRQ